MIFKVFFSKNFIKFLLSGGLAALSNWTMRVIINIWLPFNLAVFIAYLVGMTIAFLLNRNFVFPHSITPQKKQARDFIIINLCFLPIVLLFSSLFSYLLKAQGVKNYSEEIGHAFALISPVFFTFLIYKFSTFKESNIKS